MRPGDHGEGASDSPAVPDQPRAGEEAAQQVVLDRVVVLHDVVQPRPDQAAGKRGEDHLVGPVHRALELAQPPRDDRAGGQEGQREHDPEGLDREAEDVDLGLHGRSARLPARITAMASRRSSFGRDTGLQTRMLVTMFLLGLVYAALIGALFASGAGGVTIALIAGVLFVLQITTSDKIGLRVMGAKVVSPRRRRTCTRWSSGSASRPTCPSRGWPSPRPRCPTPSPWAARRSPRRSAPPRHPRAAVAGRARGRARPRAHPRHQPRRDGDDARQLLRLARLDDRPVRLLLRRRLRRRRRRGRRQHPRADPGVDGRLRASFMLMQALSRYREFAADRGSAVITGRPSALASALLKISGTMERVPSRTCARRRA